MSKVKSGKYIKNGTDDNQKISERLLLSQYRIAEKKKIKIDPITKKMIMSPTGPKKNPIEEVIDNQVVNATTAKDFIDAVMNNQEKNNLNTGSLETIPMGKEIVNGDFRKIKDFHWYVKGNEVETIDVLFETKSNLFGNQFKYRENVQLSMIANKYLQYVEGIIIAKDKSFEVEKMILECVDVYNTDSNDAPVYTTMIDYVEEEKTAYVNDPFFFNFIKVACNKEMISKDDITINEEGTQIIFDCDTNLLTNDTLVTMTNYVKLVEMSIHESYLSKIKLTKPNFNISENCINLFNVEAPICFGTLLKTYDVILTNSRLLESKYANGMMVITPIFMCFGPIMSVGFTPSINTGTNLTRSYYQRPALSGCFSIGGEIVRKTEIISNVPVVQLSGDFDLEFEYHKDIKSYKLTQNCMKHLEDESYNIVQNNLYLFSTTLKSLTITMKSLAIPSYEEQYNMSNQKVKARFISRAKFGGDQLPSDITLHITGPFRINGEIMTEVAVLIKSMCEKWNGYMPTYKTVTAKTMYMNQEVLVVPNHSNTTLLSDEYKLDPTKLTYIYDGPVQIAKSPVIQMLPVSKVIQNSSFNLTIQAYQNQGYSFSHINSFIKENWFFLDGFILLCAGVYEQMYTSNEIVSALVSFGKNFEISLSTDRNSVILKRNKNSKKKLSWKMDECVIHKSQLQVGCIRCHAVFTSIKNARSNDYQQGLYEFVNTRSYITIPDTFGINEKKEPCSHCNTLFRVRSLAQLCHNSVKDQKSGSTVKRETPKEFNENVQIINMEQDETNSLDNELIKEDDKTEIDNEIGLTLFDGLMPTPKTYTQALKTVPKKNEQQEMSSCTKDETEWNEIIKNDETKEEIQIKEEIKIEQKPVEQVTVTRSMEEEVIVTDHIIEYKERMDTNSEAIISYIKSAIEIDNEYLVNIKKIINTQDAKILELFEDKFEKIVNLKYHTNETTTLNYKINDDLINNQLLLWPKINHHKILVDNWIMTTMYLILDTINQSISTQITLNQIL